MSRTLLISGIGCSGCHPYNPCNLVAVEWLYKNPSLLLWAEHILLSEVDYRNLGLLAQHDSSRETYYKIINKLIDEDIIKVVDSEKCLHEYDERFVFNFISSNIGDVIAPVKEGEPTMVRLGKGQYCYVFVEMAVFSMLLSAKTNSSCLVDYKNMNLFNEIARGKTMASGPEVFEELYTFLVPEIDVRAYHLFCNHIDQKDCKHYEECSSKLEANARKFLDKILLLREQHDVRCLAKAMDNIENEGYDSPLEIRSALLKDLRRAEKKARSSLPITKHISEYCCRISPYVLLASELLSPETTLPVAALLAAGDCLGKVLSDISSRNSWKVTLARNIAGQGR